MTGLTNEDASAVLFQSLPTSSSGQRPNNSALTSSLEQCVVRAEHHAPSVPMGRVGHPLASIVRADDIFGRATSTVGSVATLQPFESWIGSGGDFENVFGNVDVVSTSGGPATSAPRVSSPKSTPDLRTVEGMLAHIRSSFSLNVKETAAALRVERPTVYAWTSGKSLPQSSRLGRLRRLDDFATAWDALSKQPVGRMVRQDLGEPFGSLADILTSEELVGDMLPTVLREIAAKVASKSRAGSIREAVSRHQLRSTKPEHGASVLDSLTGKRVGVDE